MAAKTYARPDWTYITSNGTEGEKPDYGPSVIFPWAGQFVMRSGWDADALWHWHPWSWYPLRKHPSEQQQTPAIVAWPLPSRIRSLERFIHKRNPVAGCSTVFSGNQNHA